MVDFDNESRKGSSNRSTSNLSAYTTKLNVDGQISYPYKRQRLEHSKTQQ